MRVLAAASEDLDVEDVAALVLRRYGIAGRPVGLRSERDQNVRIDGSDGRSVVFKLANPAQDPAVSRLQTRALRHIERVAPTLPVPRVVPTTDGAAEVEWAPSGQAPRIGWLVTFVPGVPLAEAPITPERAAEFGRIAARLGRALRGFFDPAAGHELLWDLKQAGHAAALVPCIAHEEDHRLATEAIAAFERLAAPLLPGLRGQVIHNDLNPFNVLVDPARPDIMAGVIDFGDLVFGALVNDVAIAAAYLVGDDPDPLAAVAAFVAGYAAVTPLEREEIELLPVLIATRHALTISIGAWRAASNPENASYIVRNRGAANRGLATLSRIGRRAVATRLLEACRMTR